jgi:hypothetical protein
MTRRTNKPPKRREQPWMAAARAKLRKPGGAPKAEGPRAPERGHGPQPTMVRVYADRTNRAGPPSEAELVGDALLEMAAPDLAELGPRGRREQLDQIVDAALFAYNQPIHEAAGIPAMGGLGSFLQNAMDAMFQRVPGFRARYERMLKVRTERFGHLTTIIMMCRGGFADRGGVYIDVMLPPAAAVPEA